MRNLAQQLARAPPGLLCPICEAPLQDPVIAQDGYSYCRQCIEEWFEVYESYNRTCESSETVSVKSPKTQLDLQTMQLCPNISMRQLGDAYVELVLESQELCANIMELQRVLSEAEDELVRAHNRAEESAKQNLELQAQVRALEDELFQSTEQAARLAFHFDSVCDELRSVQASKQIYSADVAPTIETKRINMFQMEIDRKDEELRQARLQLRLAQQESHNADDLLQALAERSAATDQARHEIEELCSQQAVRNAEQRRAVLKDAERRQDAQRFVVGQLESFSETVTKRSEQLAEERQKLESVQADLQKAVNGMSVHAELISVRQELMSLQAENRRLQATSGAFSPRNLDANLLSVKKQRKRLHMPQSTVESAYTTASQDVFAGVAPRAPWEDEFEVDAGETQALPRPPAPPALGRSSPPVRTMKLQPHLEHRHHTTELLQAEQRQQLQAGEELERLQAEEQARRYADRRQFRKEQNELWSERRQEIDDNSAALAPYRDRFDSGQQIYVGRSGLDQAGVSFGSDNGRGREGDIRGSDFRSGLVLSKPRYDTTGSQNPKRGSLDGDWPIERGPLQTFNDSDLE
eukprot:TRINITY_DN14248_c0_g3_i1.p1 TRINITY_DN14248_c0_g3~~TRINITY_DN14248_c0_g3_i1.p1  ORF type:complete len:582 (+),score=122.90 TRINITY_DN14248_c0_g3_i1:215-1960(+)